MKLKFCKEKSRSPALKKSISRVISTPIMLQIRDIDWEDGSLPLFLDRHGFFPLPGETLAAFRSRVQAVLSARDRIAGERSDLSDLVGFRTGAVVPMKESDLVSAQDRTERLFGFRADWTPAFYPEKGLGPLWGGCSVETESGCPVFFLRKEFQNKERMLFYRRDELSAHELCHAVRGALSDPIPEERFAYMTSRSAFRRWAGDWFRSELDALLFLLPSMLLLASQVLVSCGILSIPIWPFWIAVVLFPAFLAIRSAAAGRVFRKAERILASRGFGNPLAVLFRMTYSEMKTLAKTSRLPARDLRADVWDARFRKGETNHG